MLGCHGNADVLQTLPSKQLLFVSVPSSLVSDRRSLAQHQPEDRALNGTLEDTSVTVQTTGAGRGRVGRPHCLQTTAALLVEKAAAPRWAWARVGAQTHNNTPLGVGSRLRHGED